MEQKAIEHLVGRIHDANYLYFTEDELDVKGMGHNKPLYVTVRCKDCLIGKVLINNDSALMCYQVTVKAEETISMVRNVAVPFIEAEDCRDRDFHAFEVVNTKWVPENTVVRKPKISQATRMAAKSFLKYKIPFQYDVEVGKPERITLIKSWRGRRCKAGRRKLPGVGLGRDEVVLSVVQGELAEKKLPEWACLGQRRRRYAVIQTESFTWGCRVTVEDHFRAKLGYDKEDEAKGIMEETGVGRRDEVMFPRSGSSITTPTLYIENEWPNFKEYIVVVEEEECDKNNIREFTKLIEQQEQDWKPAKKELETIDVGTKEIKRELKIGTMSTPKEREELIVLLRDYVDVFAWSYMDMPGLDTDIVVHRVSNIVVVPKKEGKIKVCVDFRDLNWASPKDNFPLPHIDMLVDNAARSSTYSFMDGFSGYNQIKMAQEDKEKTTFVTPWGTFCYKVMPFGLKNAGATYQRAMLTLFHDMMHKEIEVLVDDMIAKSREGENHVQILKKLFERLRKYRLRLNPAKCSFGVKCGKLLGFVVSDKGIEMDPDKVRAIRSMPAPKTKKDVRGRRILEFGMKSAKKLSRKSSSIY
ncbi:uncharacterized protein [Populus alba]|uniref:uncharacterized protein n=1 Tax=Populus alba TaxID=43335 RepID=UPI003CC742CD